MTSAWINTGPDPDVTGPDPDVIAASQGDREAFGRIYSRYKSTVYRFAYFRCGHRDLAEDITSTTFLRALNGIDRYSWRGRNVGAWLVTIARNLLADYYKSGRYQYEVLSDTLNDRFREMWGTGTSTVPVDELVIEAVDMAYVRQLVNQLGTAEQRECITLRYLDQLSIVETATRMGKDEGAIKAMTYRAMRALYRLAAATEDQAASAHLVLR